MTDGNQRTNGGTGSNTTRRRFLQASGGAAGAIALGVGTGAVGSAAAAIAEFQDLSVSSDNRIVNESDETFKMRGLNIPDPKRLAITKNVRGKTPRQLLDMITNNEKGWHPRVIRVPAQPTDIGEHPNGNTGERYGEDSPPEIDPDRRKMIPAQPPAFDEEQLQDYLDTYYDPIVQRCKERGVYCIVDYHRHWHEQPPGDGPAGAENHLPYESDNTLYWCKNTYYGEDKPASWGWVDTEYRAETPGDGFVQGLSENNMDDTPYTAWEVNQELVDETIMFWDEVAERYADEPHVIYEPYNEPTAPGIWGPVEGCGAFKQKPLWETFRKDFAAPIMEKVREHAPGKLMLMGLPGWCQASQALHWGGFDEEGFEDVAAVWHNYGGHAVSQTENWLNDTDYEYMEVPNPFLDETPEDVYEQSCYGWEAYEAQGIQNAQEVHPIAVTEFGWIDSEEVSIWLQGSTTGQGTTDEYGKPVTEALESDERISWVAWCADNRWLPVMFDVDFTVAEGELDLDNGSWYDTDESAYPDNCTDLPCDWTLLGNPNMGEYVKQALAETKDDMVPFEMETVSGGANAGDGSGSGDGSDDGGEPGDGSGSGDGPTFPERAADPDGDGYYEDLNGNGRVDYDDVVTYFENMENEQMQANAAYYDYNDNGRIDYTDLIDLFNQVE